MKRPAVIYPQRTPRFMKLADDVLNGRAGFDGLTDNEANWVRSLLEMPIYKMACDVIAAPTKEFRRIKLERIPEQIRAMVEKKVYKIWEIRKNNFTK